MAETREQKWRREGRKEAAMMLMEKIDAESLEHSDLVEWSENGQCGDYSGSWNQEEVIKFFEADKCESFVEKMALKVAKSEAKSEEAFFLEQMLRQFICERAYELTSGGNTALDRAAYYLGLHPDQEN